MPFYTHEVEVAGPPELTWSLRRDVKGSRKGRGRQVAGPAGPASAAAIRRALG